MGKRVICKIVISGMQTLDVLSGFDYLMLSGKWNNGDGRVLRSYLSQPLPIGLECVCNSEYYFLLDSVT